MATFPVRVTLKDFIVRAQNEEADEPFIWPFFIRIDSRNLQGPTPTVHLDAPGGWHGDLGPRANGISKSGVHLDIPASLGEWHTTLEVGRLSTTPDTWRACVIAIAVAFLEEDVTTNAQVLGLHAEAVAEVRRQINEGLVEAMARIPGSGVSPPDGGALQQLGQAVNDQVLAAPDARPVGFGLNQDELWRRVITPIMRGIIGQLAGAMAVSPGDGGLVSALATVDQNDYVGTDFLVANVGRIIAENHVGVPIELMVGQPHNLRVDVDEIDAHANILIRPDEGIYRIEGTLRRTDTDEVPILAAVASAEDSEVRVFARHADDFYMQLRSTNSGLSFAASTEFDRTPMPQRQLFRDGPGGCALPSGSRRHLFGRGKDDFFHRASSHDHGATWEMWHRVPGMKFKSAPAAAMAADGDNQWLYLVGRGEDDRYHFASSVDGGHHWSDWAAVHTHPFRSTPALCASADGKRLSLFGLGRDQQIWTISSHDRGASWHGAWAHLPQPVGAVPSPPRTLTSAPAVALSPSGKNVFIACRGDDRIMFSCQGSSDATIFENWSPLGTRTLASAPSVTWTTGAICVAAVDNDLGISRFIFHDGGHTDWQTQTERRLDEHRTFNPMHY